MRPVHPVVDGAEEATRTPVLSRLLHQQKARTGDGVAPPAGGPPRPTLGRNLDGRARHWPALTVRGDPRRVWREHVLNRAADLAALALWLDDRTDGPSTAAAGRDADAGTDAALRARLNCAVDAANGRSLSPWARRARLERAMCSLDAAECLVLRRASPAYLTGQLPRLHAHVRAHLPPSHPERRAVEAMATADEPGPLTDEQRSTLLSAMEAANSGGRREVIRLRSFRNVVVLTTVALALLAAAFAVLGSLQPTWTPLCFAPQGMETVVCPTTSADLPDDEETDVPASVAETARVVASTAEPHDVAVVMLVGLGAAAVTGTVTLRQLRGTSTPFAVPMALVALKLPTGALTAFLGLLLINGGFVPGLSALDTSGQILAWAIVFGAAQQLVTGLVDRKAQDVLDSVGPTPMKRETE